MNTYTLPRLTLVSRVYGLLMVLALVVALLPTAQASYAVPRAQPLLRTIAAADPQAPVTVIVQKLVADRHLEEMAMCLGGMITKDLHIINAFVAHLPAQAALELARMPGVRWVSLDAPVVKTSSAESCAQCIDTTHLLGSYIQTIGADRLWNEAPYLQGQNIAVAVVDSGIAYHDDLRATAIDSYKGNGIYRIIATANFTNRGNDHYGHGTHVAGIIGGNGARSNGAYIGVAPRVNLVNVKVSDNEGSSTASDVVAGLEWIYLHKDEYNIRVVNLSLNSSTPESYHTSPLDAAVEILWFNGMVVVVSAGNNGTGSDNGILYPPANDPFVITVGATDDHGTPTPSDDTLAPFSAYGVTTDGISKPELVAPGTNIISLLSGKNSVLYRQHPDHRADGFPGKEYYFRMSGTSMAAAMTAGAIALLLQDEPHLTPDQVKYRLMATAHPIASPGVGAGSLDIYAAVHGTTTQSANTGIEASRLLWTGSTPLSWQSSAWDSASWGSASWGSASWGSASWGSASWGSVTWNSVNWGKGS